MASQRQKLFEQMTTAQTKAARKKADAFDALLACDEAGFAVKDVHKLRDAILAWRRAEQAADAAVRAHEDR